MSEPLCQCCGLPKRFCNRMKAICSAIILGSFAAMYGITILGDYHAPVHELNHGLQYGVVRRIQCCCPG